MKNRVHLSILSLATSIIFSAGLLAQEQIEVSIHVKKDGKVIKDTTYQFDDASEAMVFISEDGEKTEIKEFHGDSLVWVTEGEADGDNVKVIVIKKSGDVDMDHDEDTDHDENTDHDEDVKVKVVKKK